MKESMWLVFVLMFGLMAFFFVFFFQRVVTTSEQNYHLLKEATEGAMYDALDYSAYRAGDVIRIDQELFVEMFIRRFAEVASITDNYEISIYDVNEIPPKVSLEVISSEIGAATHTDNQRFQFNVRYRIDAILEQIK